MGKTPETPPPRPLKPRPVSTHCLGQTKPKEQTIHRQLVDPLEEDLVFQEEVLLEVFREGFDGRLEL